ncbi:hypothetical protein MKW92_053392, partial [Papaver armeniacum]
RATNHVERSAKEKHIRAIFATVSATRPCANVAYCIHALPKRLAKTHNWAPGIILLGYAPARCTWKRGLNVSVCWSKLILR